MLRGLKRCRVSQPPCPTLLSLGEGSLHALSPDLAVGCAALGRCRKVQQCLPAVTKQRSRVLNFPVYSSVFTGREVIVFTSKDTPFPEPPDSACLPLSSRTLLCTSSHNLGDKGHRSAARSSLSLCGYSLIFLLAKRPEVPMSADLPSTQ